MHTLLDVAFSMYYNEPLQAEFAAPLGGKKSRKGIKLGKAVKYGALAGGGLGLLRGRRTRGALALGAGAAEETGTNYAKDAAVGALATAGNVALGYGAYRGVKALGRKIRRSKKRKYR